MPLPLRLDPLCGASAIAVCLRALGLPHDRAALARAVPHSGEGSNLQELADACARLGVAANPVQATERGLRALPLPAVAHVEGDHFVAVVAVDGQGVEYVCSDCGAWPGGPVRVSWKAWRAMKPGAFMTVTRPGSPAQAAMERVAPPVPRTGTAVDVSVGVTQSSLGAEASRLASRLLGNVGTLQIAPGYQCKYRPNTLHCPDGVTCCPMDGSGPGTGPGPTQGEPVNLATGEEEYRPAPDLTVYNPTGPSVSFSRIYNSLRDESIGLGTGWSDSLHFGVTLVRGEAMPPGNPPPVYNPEGLKGGQTSAVGGQTNATGFVTAGYVTFPNGGGVPFDGVVPDASHPIRACTLPPGVRLKVLWKGDASVNKSYFEVTFPDRTKWITERSDATTHGLFAIKTLQDRVGNRIGFDYVAHASEDRLTRVYDAAGADLLTLGYDGSGNLVSVSDRYGRSVYYSGVIPGTGRDNAPILGSVSQIVATGTASPPVRYQLGYISRGNGEDTSGYP